MKVAFVHDDLMRRGGAEKVLLSLHKIYPDAPIFTLAYRAKNTYPEFKEKDVRTSWFQPLAINETIMKWLFYPFGVWAMQSLDLRAFDLVIISTTFGGKYVKVADHAKVYTYCYTPFRLVWRPSSYSVYRNSRGLKKVLFNWVIRKLKEIDVKAASRTDFFITMTDEMKKRIEEAYKPKNPIHISNPPIDFSGYYISPEIDDYFLVVSRLEPYKKVDLVIEAFNKCGKPLVIVGKGSQESKLKSMAKSNIIFKKGLSQEELSEVYARCKALIFPQYEDYGLTPLEANASGRPVIAYRGGGVTTTMIEFKGNEKTSTAILFNDQTVESLLEAIESFQYLNFDPKFLRNHAEKFSEAQFISEIKNLIKDTY